MKHCWLTARVTLRRWAHRFAEPLILFPTLAAVFLGVIWATTFGLLLAERAGVERAAAVSSQELGATYEAQVLRALREIDQALKVVKYAAELKGMSAILPELRTSQLLPPDLLFVVSIASADGEVVASTRPPVRANVADQEYFQLQRTGNTLAVGVPRQAPTGEWTVQFSRRIDSADGSFLGIVFISVDAAYFVSGYESGKLGEAGVLGLLGTDGIFRARRSGDNISAGDRADYAKVVTASEAEGLAPLNTNVWDGVQRYTAAHELYGLPLAVIVGLSKDEQLAASHRNRALYLWRATAGSALLLAIVVVLGRLSIQLAQTRQRAVEEQISHAAKVEYLAYHDGLTTLPNRTMFSKLLAQSTAQAQRHHRRLAVLFLDLDRFKQINDTLGHDAGDQLLKEVAVRLQACLRAGDTVARLGGDEFVALLPDLDDPRYAATVATKVLATLAQPFILLGQECRVTASIGISSYPLDGLDEQTLTKNADIAMYKAKAEGKNNFQFYSETLSVNSLERLTLESELRHALEHDEFEVIYQARHELRSNRVTGVEALLRWRHPVRGTIEPAEFMAVAEETGLILPIGRWILTTACAQSVAWQLDGLPALCVGVNLSSRQFFDEHFLANVASALQVSKMDPVLLELEASESMLMQDLQRTLRVMNGLKALGVRLVIDDFGFGYSTLSALQRFPIDAIRIDRTLVGGVATIKQGSHLAEAVIAMGRALSRTVVAQFDDTREQAEFLQARSASSALQGFHVDRPLPADRIRELLRRPGTFEPPIATRDRSAA